MALTTFAINTVEDFEALGESVQPFIRILPQANADPYISWAVWTGNQTITAAADDTESQYFNVFIELKRPGVLNSEVLRITPVRPQALSKEEGLAFIAARVQMPRGREKANADARNERWEALTNSPDIKRIVLTAPSAPPNVQDTNFEAHELAFLPSPLAGPPCPAKARTVLFGIVDDGFGLANPLLPRDPECGLRAMWHQGLRDDEPLEDESTRFNLVQQELPPEAWRKFWPPRQSTRSNVGRATAATMAFSYGFELDIHFLNQSLEGLSAAQGEVQMLREARYLFPTPRWTHGSAMADLVLRHDRAPRLCSDGKGGWHMRYPGQHGISHPYVFVQLPRSTVRDTSGVSLASYAYDAILYIMDNALEGEQVVVNLSYGTFGGPHDGSSMFERAIVDLLDRFGGDGKRVPRDRLNRTLHVVVPAGNSHLERTHFGALLSSDRPTASIHWQVLPDDETDSFVEVWLPKGAPVTITVTPPGLDPAEVGQGEQAVWLDTAQGAVGAGIFYPLEVPNGCDGTMALVAVTRTRPAKRPSAGPKPEFPPYLLAPHGIWKIDLQLDAAVCDDRTFRVDAWIQRDDAAPGQIPRRGRPSNRQSRFLDLPIHGPAAVFPECTLNGIGTTCHERLFMVGAMRGDDGTISDYSCAGPNAHPSGQRFYGPDAVAVADASPNLAGLLTGGVLSSTRLRINGTSVAAAQFSRALAAHLADGGKASSFCWGSPERPSREKLVPAGAPSHAPFIHRGECTRMPLDLNQD